MSDTPRMDLALRKAQEDCTESYLLTEGLKLERELNAANERIKNLESALCTVQNIDKVNAYQDLESANERIKRLEEAGDEAIYKTNLFDRELHWNKAKEANP